MYRDMTSEFKVRGEAGRLEAETLGSLQGAVAQSCPPRLTGQSLRRTQKELFGDGLSAEVTKLK